MSSVFNGGSNLTELLLKWTPLPLQGEMETLPCTTEVQAISRLTLDYKKYDDNDDIMVCLYNACIHLPLDILMYLVINWQVSYFVMAFAIFIHIVKIHSQLSEDAGNCLQTCQIHMYVHWHLDMFACSRIVFYLRLKLLVWGKM